MTTPGFSSRSTDTTIRQFPQRDEAAMSEMTPGWSNSGGNAPAEAKAVTEADSKVVEADVAPKKATRRTAKAEGK